MASATNRGSSGAVSKNDKSNLQQIGDDCATNTKNKKSQHPVMPLAQPSNGQENKENVLIKQLQDKVEELVKQMIECKIQIKNLEDKVTVLQGVASNASAPETHAQESTNNQTDTIVQEVAESSSTIPKSTTVGNNETRSVVSTEIPQNVIQVQHSEQCTARKEKKRPAMMGTYVFTSWMNSRDLQFSLWSNKEYSRPLRKYISKIYGQSNNMDQLLEPLRIEYNNSEELDQLYHIIKYLEKQPDADKSLDKWRTQTRPDHRFDEVKAILEYNRTCPQLAKGLGISSLRSDLEEIIPPKSIHAYFDMICRDGMITAEIGKYLGLNKENIFGGSDYVSRNERVTFVNVDLDQSTIKLDDNRVDLITCLVTLHHVPYFNSMIAELVRILRPGGYLLIREHDVKIEKSLQVKYLNFIHAFMMIARVDEFAGNSESNATDWKQTKANIINYTNSIQYRTHAEWKQALEKAGFRLRAKLDYDAWSNPQALFYAVYQLNDK